jgi:hypothetical protein
MTNEAAEIIAEFFNDIPSGYAITRLTTKMIRFMNENSYRLVDGKWHPTQAPSADEEQKLLRARVANLEIALHGMWTLLQRVTPLEEREAIGEMMNDHFRIMIEQGASGKPTFEMI